MGSNSWPSRLYPWWQAQLDGWLASGNELASHLSIDHPDAVGLEQHRAYPNTSPVEPLYPDMTEREPIRRYLVIANQTLDAEPLRTEVRRRHAQGPCEFVVSVPTTQNVDYPVRTPTATAVGLGEGTPGPAGEPGEGGVAQARSRLHALVDTLRTEGVAVRGQLGPPDPYAAAGAVLERERVDEVLLSRLPPSASRWFGVDLEQRIQHHWNVPVTGVVAEY